MRSRSMHPLCCISANSRDIGGGGDRSPPPIVDQGAEIGDAVSEDAGVAGVLHKWTNYGRGWRSRWFSLRNGVLSYSKIHRHRGDGGDLLGGGARLIGSSSARFSPDGGKPVGVVYIKVSSFRESKSDDRRFHIFSPTKTLHLRTDSKKDRVAWIEALLSFSHNNISFSTEKLRDHMRAEGLGEELIQDCEQIMLSEFSEYRRQLKVQYDEHLTLLNTFDSQLEGDNVDDENTTTHEGHLQLLHHEFSCSGHGKFSATTESSDDIGKQDIVELSDEDEPYFFDTEESFTDCHASTFPTTINMENNNNRCTFEDLIADVEPCIWTQNLSSHHTFPHVQRRKKLPDPTEKEKCVSLWSVIKDNVGKDLTRVCLPVYFNEPLSSLQKCFEDLEYSYLLDRAYECGKMGNSLMRILNVAAFAVSGYASSDGRPCKPFNPLLGETYEADYPEKGIKRFFSEKCEGKGWKFWGDSNLRSKFWGRSIQLDPVGILTLEFEDGEIFQWSKVTTTIYNLILGKVYCDHHGTMEIKGNREYSCNLKFKEQSFLDRSPRQVQGFVEDSMGTKVATLRGKWDDSLYYTAGADVSKTKGSMSPQKASLLWQRSKPPTDPTRYNLSSFAITLNELTPELQEKLPPTDSRLRPDQRYLENGEYEKANEEKLRLEKRQRMSGKLQDDGWKPRWFQRDDKSGTYRCYRFTLCNRAINRLIVTG
ncbi:hypothetical protein J5N97_029880 [Dioscorea zingiberensis]|uniref:PH domain-containing protein n=1 Tax=Dioscorea zingiberensis TaxID=325984 RepID=A0A9D5BWP3_9LILI|nr:hypothetical protein J5N97_029880 [Dioscorea zingiberensis]